MSSDLKSIRPAHYTDAKHEARRVIEGLSLGRGFHLGSVLKYLSRAGKKPGESARKDLTKTITYLRFELEMAEHGGDEEHACDRVARDWELNRRQRRALACIYRYATGKTDEQALRDAISELERDLEENE